MSWKCIGCKKGQPAGTKIPEKPAYPTEREIAALRTLNYAPQQTDEIQRFQAGTPHLCQKCTRQVSQFRTQGIDPSLVTMYDQFGAEREAAAYRQDQERQRQGNPDPWRTRSFNPRY